MGNLNECERFQQMAGKKIWNFMTLCRSSSQLQGPFEKFNEILDLNIESAV